MVSSVDKQVFLTIVAMATVTYIPRLVPLVLLSGRTLPRPVMAWLRLLPAALLGALVAQAVAMPDGDNVINLTIHNPSVVPALVAAVTAWRFRSLALTVLSGMVTAGVTHLLSGA